MATHRPPDRRPDRRPQRHASPSSHRARTEGVVVPLPLIDPVTPADRPSGETTTDTHGEVPASAAIAVFGSSRAARPAIRIERVETEPFDEHTYRDAVTALAALITHTTAADQPTTIPHESS